MSRSRRFDFNPSRQPLWYRATEPRTGTHGGVGHENSGHPGKPPEGQHLSGGRIEGVMRPLGDVEFEYLMLSNVRLEPCRGCLACFEWGEERCPVRDDGTARLRALPRPTGIPPLGEEEELTPPFFRRHTMDPPLMGPLVKTRGAGGSRHRTPSSNIAAIPVLPE